MLIPVSATVTLKTRYTQPRGSVFQFVKHAPSDIVQRYGQKFIRIR